MRTIDIMTMAFLPGTFLAALFAMPSLDRSGPKVITSNFWVHWAFTIPFTLVVFIAWRVLSLDRPLSDIIAHRKELSTISWGTTQLSSHRCTMDLAGIETDVSGM